MNLKANVLKGGMVNALTSESIRAKRAAIERQIRDAEQAIAGLRLVLGDLDAAERVLQMLSTQNADLFAELATATVVHPVTMSAVFLTKAYGGGSATDSRNPFRPGTNKAFIWEVLSKSEKPWMTANQIQEGASKLKGEAIPMASISPMLSEMKGDYLERDNLLVALKSRINENGAGDDQTPSAPDTALDAHQKETTE